MKYVRHVSTRKTPQSRRIPGANQIANRAGGYGFQVDDWMRLDRFLILGSEGGSYYASEHELTRDNAEAVLRCIKSDGARTVNRIREISQAGRAPKNDPALFALAMAAKLGDEPTRKAAFAALPDVARTGTHLFHFAEAVQAFGGWGRATTRAFADWYRREAVQEIVYQAIKYRQRDGWTHADILRLSHPVAPSAAHRQLYAWIVDGVLPSEDGALDQIKAFETLQHTTDPDKAADIIAKYRLPWEAVPTDLRWSPAVWAALLPEMPITAMIRNLGTMTSVGLLAAFSDGTKKVVDRLGNTEALRRSRVHPMAILAALRTYGQGKGFRGSGTWDPVAPIVDALDAAFYASFGNVAATGKRFLVAVDVSGSMQSPASGFPMRAAETAAAMAFVMVKTEPNVVALAFSSRGYLRGKQGFEVLDFSKMQRLDDAVNRVRTLDGGTDCAIPAEWALTSRTNVDVLAIFTDEETWAGNQHPIQAVDAYRRAVNPVAKFVSANFVAHAYSIARASKKEPEVDPFSLRVVGFDTTVPTVISDFAANG
jgi:60 kDa SS-A/Ro ribonucleoprotein